MRNILDTPDSEESLLVEATKIREQARETNELWNTTISRLAEITKNIQENSEQENLQELDGLPDRFQEIQRNTARHNHEMQDLAERYEILRADPKAQAGNTLPGIDHKDMIRQISRALNKSLENHVYIRIHNGTTDMTEETVKILFDLQGRLTHGDAAWDARPGGVEHLYNRFIEQSDMRMPRQRQ